MEKTAELKRIWNQVPKGYYEEGKKSNILQRIWHGEKWKSLAKSIKEIRSANSVKRVLDVGCASGHITYKVHKLLPWAEVIGLDVYAKSIAFARKRYKGVKFVVADAHNLPFPAKSFDIVLSTESLEHVVNPHKALLEMRRVLRDDGKLLVEMDSGNWLFRITWFFWKAIGPGKVWRGSHLTHYNTDKLERDIKDAGFIIRKKKTTHWGMGVIFVAKKK